MLSSQEIIRTFNGLGERVRDRDVAEKLEKIRLAQETAMNNIIKENSASLPCNNSTLDTMRIHMANLKGNILKEILVQQPQNAHALEVAKCTVNSIFYASPYDISSL